MEKDRRLFPAVQRDREKKDIYYVRSWCFRPACAKCNSAVKGLQRYHYLSVKEYEEPASFLYHMRMRELILVNKTFKSIVEHCYEKSSGFYSLQAHGHPWVVKEIDGCG